MRFAILVNQSPYQYQASDTAYRFTHAALAAGHEVVRVFFYHDGVYNGNRLNAPPQDERDIGQMWQSLARDHGVELAICVAAGQRRGVLDKAESQRLEKAGSNLADEFRITGLGQWVEAMVEADRVMVFGG